MSISATGEGLDILISTACSIHQDWQAFSAWYSIYRNLPDARVSILCARDFANGKVPFNWPIRCGVSFFQHENIGKRLGCLHLNKIYAIYVALKEGLVRSPLLVIDSDVVALRTLSKKTLTSNYVVAKPVWFFKELTCERIAGILNRYEGDDIEKMLSEEFGEPELVEDLCCDVTSERQCTFVHCNKQLGRYNKKEWMKARKVSPFGFTDEIMKDLIGSANERSVVELWSDMQIVYNTVH